MKTIMLHASSFDTFWAHYHFYKDEDFYNKFSVLGYRLILSNQGNLKETDWVLFLEATSVGSRYLGIKWKIKQFIKKLIRYSNNQRNVYKEASILLPKRLALIAMESKLHLPENYDVDLYSRLPIVFTWNDKLVDGNHIFKFSIPQPVSWSKIEHIPFDKRKLLVNISTNKYINSSVELYSKRRASIRYFQKALPNDFDLYGFDWNTPVTFKQRLFKSTVPYYSSYRGSVNDKAAVFPQYRFGICYENSCEEGYITEKIFDCMRSGCVPIYWGAPNITEYVSQEAFIDRSRFSSDIELSDFLINISEQEYQRYQIAIKDYLVSQKFKSFLAPAFAETIASVLDRWRELNR